MAHKILGTPQIPLNATVGKVLKSDASGNMAWASNTMPLFSAHHVVGSGAAANTWLMWEGGAVIGLGVSATAAAARYLDPADYIGQKLRVRGWVVVNAVAPAITFTFGLYPITTWGGASNIRSSINAIGAATGSVAIASPAAAGPTVGTSADFAFPTAGYYCLCVVTSGTSASNSQTEIAIQLDSRNT